MNTSDGYGFQVKAFKKTKVPPPCSFPFTASRDGNPQAHLINHKLKTADSLPAGCLNDFTVQTADQEHLPWTINVNKNQIFGAIVYVTSIQYHDPTVRINEHYFLYVQRAKRPFPPFSS